MIVRVMLRNESGEEYCMMFGTSYKKWQTQFEEFMNRYEQPVSLGLRIKDTHLILEAWYSHSKWIGYGGLKWCSEHVFQDELDAEAEGLKLKRCRLYSGMKFHQMPVFKLRDLL